MGKVIGTCGHELNWSSEREEFGHVVPVHDTDDFGNEAISYFSICDNCLEEYKDQGLIVSSEEVADFFKPSPKRIKCDICKKEVFAEEDIVEYQEFSKIDFVGGYGSVFGDGTRIECNICQHCLKEKLGDYLIFKENVL